MNYLKFMFRSDNPDLHIDNWRQIRSELYPFNIKKKNALLENVQYNFNSETNKSLPILKRHEGLLGGDSNVNNKQLRLIPEEYPHNRQYYKDNEVIGCSNSYPILISYFDSGNKEEVWSEDDLDDIIQSFKKTLYDVLHKKCKLDDISLYIEGKNIKYANHN